MMNTGLYNMFTVFRAHMLRVCVATGVLTMGTTASFAQPTPPVKPVGSQIPTTDVNFDGLLTGFFPRLISWLIGFIAVVAVFMVIWGGYEFFTALGDTSKAERAVKAIQWATTGLTIALISFIIVQVIVNIRLIPA